MYKTKPQTYHISNKSSFYANNNAFGFVYKYIGRERDSGTLREKSSSFHLRKATCSTKAIIGMFVIASHSKYVQRVSWKKLVRCLG